MSNAPLVFTAINSGKERIYLKWDSYIHLLIANKLSEITEIIKKVEKYTSRGYWAAGYIAFETSKAFNQSYPYPKQHVLPLAAFYILSTPSTLCKLPENKRDYYLGPIYPEVDRDKYTLLVEKTKQHLQRGDTYLLNLTYRSRGAFEGDEFSLFLDLLKSTSAKYPLFMKIPRFSILSLSPELFLLKKGDLYISEPIKGTLPLDKNPALLHLDKKERSQNIMVTDVIRNDFYYTTKGNAKLKVDLFNITKLPYAYQMSSLIKCKSNKSLFEVIKGLFPPASVTGAPKLETTKIIDRLEVSPRGVYSGISGWIKPGAAEACFNVAIRTAIIDNLHKVFTYGTGGGISYDSKPDEEYRETLIKSSFLPCAKNPDFKIITTLLIEKGEPFLLDMHIKRLEKTSKFFNFIFDKRLLLSYLNELSLPKNRSYKVRILISHSGKIELEHYELSSLETPIELHISPSPIDTYDPFIRFKTDRRIVHKTSKNVESLFVNGAGYVTESSNFNVIFEKYEQRITPPLECGLLDGIMRRYLLDRGFCTEKKIKVSETHNYQIMLCNSVRKIVPAIIKNVR